MEEAARTIGRIPTGAGGHIARTAEKEVGTDAPSTACTRTRSLCATTVARTTHIRGEEEDRALPKSGSEAGFARSLRLEQRLPHRLPIGGDAEPPLK